MAAIIPNINTLRRLTPGERRFGRQFDDAQKEAHYIARCINKWRQQGRALNSIAVIYAKHWQAQHMQAAMKAAGIPSTWLKSSPYKKAYDPSADKVTLLTRQSSKGLEFDTVILAGLGGLDDSDEQLPIETRLLYVGMTRAQRQLLVTSSGENTFTEKLQELVGAAA